MGCAENQNVFEERKLEPQGYTVRPIFQVGCDSTNRRSKLTKYFGRWISTILHHFSSASPVPPSLNIGSFINASRFFSFMGPRCPNIKYGGEGGSTSTGLDKWCRILLLHCLQVSEYGEKTKHSPPNCTQPPPLNAKASTSICKRRGTPHHTQHQSRILENKQLHTPWILENQQLHTPCQLHV
jgi:hypothetical protein